jgi:hypothetical protein
MDNGGDGTRYRSILFMGLFTIITAVAGSFYAALLGEKKNRRRPIVRGLHVGPGIYDDFKFLLDPTIMYSPIYTAAQVHAYYLMFEKAFRIDVATFNFLSVKLRRALRPQRRDSRGRKSISVNMIIATALIYLSTGNSFNSVASQMRNGMSATSVQRCVKMFNKAIIRVLGPSIITFPKSRAGLERNAHSFERRSMIPNIVGAIDGSHIRVAAPKRNEDSYFNRKKFHSIILQGIVDPRGYFMAADCGFPGRMGDAKVLRHTAVYDNAMKWFGRFGYYIYGDDAYPLRPWLMTGYSKPSANQETFNHYGSKARIIVEAAFGKLKGQWRCLTVGLRTRSTTDWKETVMSCIILHNLTILISGKGWSWRAGVVHDSTEHKAFRCDPVPVGNHNRERLPDDNSCKPRRDALLQQLLERI